MEPSSNAMYSPALAAAPPSALAASVPTPAIAACALAPSRLCKLGRETLHERLCVRRLRVRRLRVRVGVRERAVRHRSGLNDQLIS